MQSYKHSEHCAIGFRIDIESFANASFQTLNNNPVAELIFRGYLEISK